jgi:hypothetical protein
MSSIASTPFVRRKKQTVYGRSSSKPNNAGNVAFFEDDETPWEEPTTRRLKKQPTIAPISRNKAASPPRATQPELPAKKRGALPKVTQSQPREKDTFDVPSDDDETTETFSKILVPPKQLIKSRLLDEPKEEVARLAPWERKVNRKGNLQSAAATRASRSKTSENVIGEKLSDKKRGGSGLEKARSNEAQQSHVEQDSQESVGLTAMERLAARRRQVHASDQHNGEGPSKDPPKRSAVKANTQEAPQHKKRRMTPQPTSPPAAISAAESTSAAMPSIAITGKARPTSGGDIFDVPSDDEPARLGKSTKAKSPRVRQRPRGLGGLRKVTPQKGLSAPARLHDMISNDDEFAFPTTESPPSGKPTTPQTALKDRSKGSPSTPISSRSSTSHGHRPDALTPKQTQLWADLLEPTLIPDTGMKKLSITEDTMQSKSVRRAPAALERSSSDVPMRRTRVIDRLKASAPNSSDEDESQDEDDEMELDKPTFDTPAVQPTGVEGAASQVTNALSQTGQSQDRPTKATASGSLITYAKQRSHLADDNLESALMLDIPMVVPERPAATARRVGRPAAAARTISHDMEELDEAPAGGLRTIHELRAGGRNVRLMGEIEDLLGEIADHAPSARSRRRGALLDLATKLMDKTFAEQMFRHGYENALLLECKTFADAPADFLLATILVLLLHAEPPSQTLGSFEEALPCIGRLLSRSSDIARVAKERQSNMSRSAQGDLATFTNTLKAHGALWGESQPPVISSRIVSLKAIDLTVRKLRAMGNKSELLDSESLTLLLPKGTFTGLQTNAGKAFEATLVISILESLKTLSAAGSWPDSCTTSVATLPAVFAEEWQVPPDTKWVAYRLCANITNESTLVQAAFVERDAVRHIMAEIVHGFDLLHSPSTTASAPEANAKRDFDVLVLAIGALINLTEHSAVAQQQAIHETAQPSLAAIVHIFLEAQKHVLEADSVEQVEANVVYGYLAIMLANICQDGEARKLVRSLLPGGKLDVLVAAVEEFVQHHEKAGAQQESGDTVEEWGNFTERLLGVLAKLKAAERDGE